MLQQRRHWKAPHLLLLMSITFSHAIEDITNRKALFGVPTKIETDEISSPLNNELFLFHEDGRIELIQDPNTEQPNEPTIEDSNNHRDFRAKPLPTITVEKGNERKPIDNFGNLYQQLNESIFDQAKAEKNDFDNPYPPLPTIEFNDDPTPITEIPISKSSLGRGQVFEHVTDDNLLGADDFNSGYRPTTEVQFLRTTTQEPGPLRTTNYVTTRGTSTSAFLYSQQTPPAEGRFHHFREQELLDENRGFTTTTTSIPHHDNGSGNDLDTDENVPPPPAPDWAVNMVMSPDSSTDSSPSPEPGTDEPFLVTDSLKNAFSTPNGGEVAEETTRKPAYSTTTVASLRTTNNMEHEAPTMKMFSWEMSRGDIDVRGNSQYNMRPTAQNTFTPISKRRPQPTDSTSGSVLMPQEVPNDVDLPRTYEIGPRFVLPQDKDEGSGSGHSSNEIVVDLPKPQNPPIAPPTLVSAERDRNELKKEVEDELHRINQPIPTSDISLHTAPRRGGGSAPLVPISTPQTVPNSLATFGQKDRLPSAGGIVSTNKARPVTLANAPFTSFTRPVATSSAIKVTSEDYSNEVETVDRHLFQTLATKPPGDHNSLIALPPSPDYRPGYTNQPGYEPNGPPGIVIVSSPPGYFPDNLIATTPSYLPKTSTPYYTKILVPKRPSTKTHSNDPNREYSPRVSTTTQTPQSTTTQNYQDGANNDDYVNQRVSYGNFGRIRPTSAVAYDPNVKLNNTANYFTSTQDRSQHILNSPSIRLPERTSYKLPDARLKVYDPPATAMSSQIVQGGRAAFFFIPPPVRLSMSKAIKLKPFHSVFPPVHTPRHLLQNAVPTIPPQLPFLSPTTQRPPFSQRTTPSRLTKFRDNQSLLTNSLHMSHNQLNWIPIGLAAPKRLGAVKLVPAHSMQERIEIQPIEDLDAKRSDQICTINAQDEFADLRLETRQIARKCFQRAVNCLLYEIVPLERRISYTEEQCLNFCGHHPFCRSLVYSTTMSICDIFDSRNGTGPTRAVSYAGSKYYEPLNSIAMDCWKARLNDKFFTKAPQSSVLVDSDDKDDVANDQKQNDEEQNLTDKSSKSAPVVVAPKDHCDIDKDVVVLRSVGFRLRNLGVPALHQNSSETECVFSCLVNLARGHVPYNCASTSYGKLNGCLIYRTGSTNTHGNGHLVPESSFTHYEKACVSNQLVDLCRGYPIVRLPQHTLLGYSKQAVQAQSLIECLELCFNDYVQGGNCKSVSYYYEERKDNCILNTESRQSMPQFFITEDDETVDYASFESCFNAKGDLRHKALKEQSPMHLLRKPPRLTDRRFVPHAIRPPIGASFKKSTAVYTSTLVTRPPPQTYFPKDQQKEIINTNNNHVYIVDADKQPRTKDKGSKRRNPKIPIKKFVITSEEQPKQFGSKEGDGSTESTNYNPVRKELSRILHDSIRKIGVRRR